MKKSFNKKLFTEKQWKELGYTSDLAITVIYKNNEIFDLSEK